MDSLKIGFSVVNINPPLGIGMWGYYQPRFAKGFLDDLEVRTLVLRKSNQTIALISVDCCGIYENVRDRFAELIEKETGVLKENIFLSATHTHTGPLIEKSTAFIADMKLVKSFTLFLGERIADSVKLALNDLKPAKMGYITGYAPERVAYIRRYKMKDGSTMTCPPIGDPNIDFPLGTLDQRVNLLRFDRQNAPSVLLINYGLHADTTGGELISADWPYWMRKTLKKSLDGAECIFFNGAEGDVGSTNVFPEGGDMNDTEISFDNEMKSPGMARFIGRAIAGTILGVFDKAKYVDACDINMVQKTIKVPSNMPDKEEIPLAKKYKELHDAGRDDEIPYKAMELTTVVAEALRICRLENGPEYFDVRLTGVKIGPVALVGISGEPFSEIGMKIKEADGWELIMPCSLTNGMTGYFPTKSAYDEGGYEAKSSPFGAEVSDKIIEGATTLLKFMKN